MDLKYFKTFKTIIDEGSFQRAAERLNYSQSTVTFQMQQLEKELDIKLFEKIGRKMMITHAGTELLPHIEEILEKVAFLESYGKELHDFSGEINISMAGTLLTYKSQEALKRFREQAPNVKLSLQMENCYKVREQLINGQIDCGFHYDVGGYGENLQMEKLADYELTLICSPLFTDRDFITRKQQKSVCIITEDKNSIFLNRLTDYLNEQEILLTNSIELRSVEAIKKSVESNVGIAILPRFTVEKELNEGSLHEIDIPLKNKKVSAIYIYHKNKWLSPALKYFIKLMKETLRES